MSSTFWAGIALRMLHNAQIYWDLCMFPTQDKSWCPPSFRAKHWKINYLQPSLCCQLRGSSEKQPQQQRPAGVRRCCRDRWRRHTYRMWQQRLEEAGHSKHFLNILISDSPEVHLYFSTFYFKFEYTWTAIKNLKKKKNSTLMHLKTWDTIMPRVTSPCKGCQGQTE